MSSKDEIIANIRRNIRTEYDMPDRMIEAIEFADKTKQFAWVMGMVGGTVVEIPDDEDVNTHIRALYPDARTIASAIPSVTVATVNPDKVGTPYELNGTDLAVIQGEIGVAENGCIWIPQNMKEKAAYFIAEYLIILLDKENLVHTMHEAYERIQMNEYGFGVFISGPSKTADIEQALVVGAHGAKGVTVFLTTKKAAGLQAADNRQM